jgi:hypothetical protein
VLAENDEINKSKENINISMKHTVGDTPTAAPPAYG